MHQVIQKKEGVKTVTPKHPNTRTSYLPSTIKEDSMAQYTLE